MARLLQDEPDVGHTLQRIVEEAVHHIPGADFCGITQIRDSEYLTSASTDPVVERVDRVQYRTADGPCVEAIRQRATVWSTDLRKEKRWPEFARHTVALGITSMMSFQLFVNARDVGALNLYSRAPGAFDAADEQIGLLLASHAAVALVGAERVSNLHQALITRDLIGQAKGILIERYKITGETAFQLLVRMSKDSNRKLRDIAQTLVDTGTYER